LDVGGPLFIFLGAVLVHMCLPAEFWVQRRIVDGWNVAPQTRSTIPVAVKQWTVHVWPEWNEKRRGGMLSKFLRNANDRSACKHSQPMRHGQYSQGTQTSTGQPSPCERHKALISLTGIVSFPSNRLYRVVQC